MLEGTRSNTSSQINLRGVLIMRELDYFRKLNQTPRQQEFLQKISESRGYKDNEILNAYRAIFIPNYNEMIEMLAHTSINPLLYNHDGRSFVPGKLFIPGFTPLGHLVTYVCYDPIARMEASETGVYDKPYYFYPEESTGFKKSNFFLMPYESWEIAFNTGKISVADGVFDAGAVSVCGVPCGANLGTTLGLGVKKILSVFDEVNTFKDNDSAGTELYISLTKSLRNVKLTKVPHMIGKDIDGFIVKEGREAFMSCINENGEIDLVSKRFERFN